MGSSAPAMESVECNNRTFPPTDHASQEAIRFGHLGGRGPARVRGAAWRYFGNDQGQAWIDQLPSDSRMWRIAVTPTWANVLDFETRFPSAMGAA